MTNRNKNKRSRRNFLATGILAGVALITEKSAAGNLAAADSKKIKMLTADGQLVEVEESLINTARKGEKAGSESILKWMQSGAEKNK